MKRIPATLGALSLLLLLTVASCTSTLSDEPTTDIRAISFMPTAETRAAVTGTSLPDGSSFSVWGWYGTEGTITNNVFNRETVTESGGAWTYGGGSRYWIAGKTYNFYAVYPADVVADVSTDGSITVTNFDCSKTGDAAVDLMTATATGITYTAEQIPQPVAMKFSHLLSKVNIVATVEGGNVTVTDITFAGMVTQGDYSSQAGWTTPATATGSFTSSEKKVINATGVDLLGDLLLIPQTVTDQFKITVNYTLDGVVQAPKEITLPTSIAQWEAGKNYKYTLTFKGDNIIFTVNVAAWNHSTGGIITVE